MRARPAAMILTWILVASPAHAQVRRLPPPRREPPISIRGFGDVGMRTFVATESFRAVLGRPLGPLFGGGVDVILPRGIFGELRASRFRKTGERVFVFGGQVIKLGVPNTITITPVEASVGARFSRRSQLTPYLAGGVGWHRYREAAPGASDEEDVTETFTGYHALGGVELRLGRWFGLEGEAQWTFVPNALGQDPNGVSTAFGETDLGGGTVRVKLVIGR